MSGAAPYPRPYAIQRKGIDSQQLMLFRGLYREPVLNSDRIGDIPVTIAMEQMALQMNSESGS